MEERNKLWFGSNMLFGYHKDPWKDCTVLTLPSHLNKVHYYYYYYYYYCYYYYYKYWLLNSIKLN